LNQVIGKRARRGLWAALAAGLVMSAAVPVLAAASASDPGHLAFNIVEGENLNSFLRDGPVAAHLLLRTGREPRILVAFPAGNSGVGLWFEPTPTPVSWRLVGEPKPVVLKDAKGRPLYGIETTAEAKAAALTPKQAVLSSVRVLRDYNTAHGTVPGDVLTEPQIEGDRIVWSRDRLDGAAGYRLSLAVTDGAISKGRLVPGKDGVIRMRITALSGEPPLTPLGGDQLLNAQAQTDASARDALNFLSYKEKFLAGSWRFDTYFGRDTLMSVRLLMPALQPEAVDGGLRSVLARLSPQGEVAHEEDIGEFAVLDHLKTGAPKSDAPTFDYGMIDSSYMLAPVAAAWLLDDPRGRADAAAFLASPSGRAGDAQETSGAALVRNLRLVLQQTRPFAEAPTAQHLLEIKPGRTTGQWRDSGTGLGNGRYPYDVNAVFAPAALSGIARMYAAGLLDPYLTPADREAFAGAGRLAETWRTSAPHFFEVQVPSVEASRDVAGYAKAEGVPDAPALKGLGSGPLRFHALALNADGSPVRVVNSDESFELLFGSPDPATLSWQIAALMRPFPAGLMTPIGLLVADPVYADSQEKALFTRNAYHGLVVWSWHQALLAAGLERQLERTDLPAPVRAELEEAQKTLWAAIARGKAVANSELWSWDYADGGYKIVPFGASQGDWDESNAAQLWSTVFLALKPPAA
jgi:hypothetical protein